MLKGQMSLSMPGGQVIADLGRWRQKIAQTACPDSRLQSKMRDLWQPASR
jgi:hypothetical protein